MNIHKRPGGDTTRRSLGFRALVKTVGVGALDFILLRVWAPNLINMHQDLALAAAIACVALALVVTGWWALRLWSDFGFLRHRRRRLAPQRSQTIED